MCHAFLYKVFLAQVSSLNTMVLYSVQKSCIHVTKIARFDWLDVFVADNISVIFSIRQYKKMLELA